VLEFYLAGKLERRIRRKAERASDEVLREAEVAALRREERAVMELLKEQMKMKHRG
jgi:hypothetical protein